jgi:NAD(P)H-dependent flavin oxidoreductase YrpB (nitropropane dioxygenase family)
MNAYNSWRTTSATRALNIDLPIVLGPFGGVSQLRLKANEMGAAELLSLWAGQSAPLIRHDSALELIDSLVGAADMHF